MTRIPIPLYIEARNPDGKQIRMLADPAHAGQGPWLGRVAAPSGLEAHGMLSSLDPDTVAGLFGNIDKLELLVDVDGVGAQGTDGLLETHICFWSGDKPLGEGATDRASVGGDRLKALALDAPRADHIQVWTDDGAVLVAAWPGLGLLVPVPGYAGAERRVQPLVLGADPRFSAYWGFFRHGEWQAAALLGRELLARANSEKTEVSFDELIVAGHFALNSAPPEFSTIRTLVERLADESSGGDGKLLYWALAFDGLIPSMPAESEEALAKALEALRAGQCSRTEAFRQLMQRLGDAEAEVDRKGDRLPSELVDRVREAIPWARKLASATYWDCEYLTYRAISPSEPYPTATSRDIAAGAKKKSE